MWSGMKEEYGRNNVLEKHSGIPAIMIQHLEGFLELGSVSSPIHTYIYDVFVGWQEGFED